MNVYKTNSILLRIAKSKNRILKPYTVKGSISGIVSGVVVSG